VIEQKHVLQSGSPMLQPLEITERRMSSELPITSREPEAGAGSQEMRVRRLGGSKAGKARHSTHVFVATPAYNGFVHDAYSQSLAEAAFTCPLFGVGFTSSTMRGGMFIDLSRNLFVHWFLTQENLKECTHLFFIDSDLAFEARGFVGLIKSNQPICAGAYRRRQKIEDYPVARAENPNGGGLWAETDTNGREWIMADRAPTGFMCISRQVLQEMSDTVRKVNIQGQGDIPWLFETYINDKGQFIGEDFSFCDKYKEKYGKPIPVYPDLDFSHDGYEGNYKAWLLKEIDKADKEAEKAKVESVMVEVPSNRSAA
jgi:hypothetical protein